MKTCDLDVGGVVGEEKDRSVKFVRGVQNLSTREAIPPGLTVTVDDTLSVNLYVPNKWSAF